MNVSCVAVIGGFVVGNRLARFAEAPVHDRDVGEDRTPVGRVFFGSIFPEIFQTTGAIPACTNVSLTPDRPSNRKPSRCASEVGFPCPDINRRIVFPEIFCWTTTMARIFACSYISFAADGKSHCSVPSRSPEVGYLCPYIRDRIVLPEIFVVPRVASTDISLTANGKPHWTASARSLKIAFLR